MILTDFQKDMHARILSAALKVMPEAEYVVEFEGDTFEGDVGGDTLIVVKRADGVDLALVTIDEDGCFEFHFF